MKIPRSDVSKFSARKSLADRGQSFEKSRKIYKMEMVTRRNLTDFPFGDNWERYWLGRVAEEFSDFGMSIARPILYLVISFVLWSFVYSVSSQLLRPEKACSPEFQCAAKMQPVVNSSDTISKQEHNVDRSGNQIRGNCGNLLVQAAVLSFSYSLVVPSYFDPDVREHAVNCLYPND